MNIGKKYDLINNINNSTLNNNYNNNEFIFN